MKAPTRRKSEESFSSAPGFSSTSPSVTTYLPTDWAKEIYEAGAVEFDSFAGQLTHGAWSPTIATGSLTNAEACANARPFLAYAQALGNRVAPQRV